MSSLDDFFLHQASICVQNGFHKHLLYQGPALLKIINEYINFCEAENPDLSDPMDVDRPESPTDPKAKFLLTNLELQNERDCPVLELVEVPKVPISISLFSFFCYIRAIF